MTGSNRQPVLLLALIGIILLLAACASKPPVTADPPVQAPSAEQAEARDLRSRVQRFAFNEAAPADYTKAESAFSSAEAAYQSQPELSTSSYLEASALYRQVIRAGMRAKLDGYRTSLSEQRSQAVALKADVAARTLFQQAQADWDAAEALDAEADLETAITLYEKAVAGFRQASEEAQSLRERALEALTASDRKQAELDTQLTDLEKSIETEGGNAP